MIWFYGRMYDQTDKVWIDSDYRKYTIATLLKDVELPEWDLNNNNGSSSFQDMSAFDYDDDTNVGMQINIRARVADHEYRIYTDNNNYIARLPSTDNSWAYCVIHWSGDKYNNKTIYRFFGYNRNPADNVIPISYMNNPSEISGIETSRSASVIQWDGESQSYKAYWGQVNVQWPNAYPAFTYLMNVLSVNPAEPNPTDPYYKGGESDIGGGNGNFDNTGDNVDIPPLPASSAVDSGFISIYNPSLAQLKTLCSYMWSDAFDLNTFRKLFADPMDAILGLSIVPVAVPNGENTNVKVGNISTDVLMTKAASQYVEVDCGTLEIKEFWGSYLDYDPYTRAEIYLPYIGIHPLSVDDIMGKTVHVVYHVDILSGACCAYIKCGSSVLYSFVGQCASSIPITSIDWTNVINGALNIAGSIGTMVATGGASAPMSIGTIASTAVNSFKPTIEKSGAISGTGGLLGVQTPYIILTRPRQALPSKQNAFSGYPSFITTKLSDLSGYTEIDSIHLENIGATESEVNEIESLLKSGVIF